MGTDEQIFPADGEGPARRKTINPFLLQTFEVTNDEFEKFVDVTSYVTEVNFIMGFNVIFFICILLILRFF